MSLTGQEDEFRRLFEDEARTRLAALAEQAMELERRGEDADVIAEMFRNAHTLKGGAAVVGLRDLAEVLHDVEQVLDDLRGGRMQVQPRMVDALLGTVDALRDLVEATMRDADTAPLAAAVREGVERIRGLPSAPPAALEPARAPATARSEPQRSIPVPVQRLDELVRLVGESAGAHLRVGRLISERLGDDPVALDDYRDLARVLRELQDKTMRARMVSVATIAGPLRRAVRDLARDAGKQVRLELVGEDTELDRHVLEQLREPLVAMMRNAVAHGLEAPAERRAAGKDEQGLVRLHAMQIGSEVVISVADDGRGIDLDAVRAQMGERGARASDEEVMSAIFGAGLSTAVSVTGVSGRGVGLDAVRAAVDLLRGRVEVHTAVGAGTEFRIAVPMTLAVLPCLVLGHAGRRAAIPMHAVAGVLAASVDEQVSAEGHPAVWVGRDAVWVSDLAAVLGHEPGDLRGPVLVLSTSAGRHAFRVGDIEGQREVVVKDLGHLLPRLPLVAGASVETDGSVMIVLDPTGLIEAARDAATRAALPRPPQQPRPVEIAAAPRRCVLVVDDALTVRELQRSILERAGFEVRTAADGEAALLSLAERPVDLVLTDIEMPRLDGFELTQAMRADPALAGIPIVMLTSREDPQDRVRGLEAGADAYIVKSAFDEHALLRAVNGLIEERA